LILVNRSCAYHLAHVPRTSNPTVKWILAAAAILLAVMLTVPAHETHSTSDRSPDGLAHHDASAAGGGSVRDLQILNRR
jgi:hypothetical protein